MESNKENKFLSAYDQDKKKTNNRKVDALPRGAYEMAHTQLKNLKDKALTKRIPPILKGCD